MVVVAGVEVDLGEQLASRVTDCKPHHEIVKYRMGAHRRRLGS